MNKPISGAARLTMPGGELLHGDVWDRILIAAIFGGMLALAYLPFGTNLLDPILQAVDIGAWGTLATQPTVLWLSMGMLLLFVRTVLWLRYRPLAANANARVPHLTVIIPAFNEGRMVERSIHSVAQADYPRDRLEIIVVDDGSRDNTWFYMRRAAECYPQLVHAVRFESNRGKRAALAEGFRRARGEVVVTVDSDSIIERGTLRAMVAPFENAIVGAVAGKVAVLNRRDGLLPRMLHVRFVLSFDFLRSAQSTFGTVYCCPGALAAYRTSVVHRVLERWENQTFLGARCTIGEDRALTNSILELGYDSVYQRNAVVHTVVPETYAKLCKMYLRWTRSFLREEIRFARIVWKRKPLKMTAAVIETTITNLRYPVAYISIALWMARAAHDPHAIARMLFAIGIASAFYMLYYLRSERSWDFVFGVLYSYFSIVALSWILPYAALTLRARSWLTR
ncbi:MAG TPA: glycosyltransferase [Burkholderiales bacterium]